MSFFLGTIKKCWFFELSVMSCALAHHIFVGHKSFFLSHKFKLDSRALKEKGAQRKMEIERGPQFLSHFHSLSFSLSSLSRFHTHTHITHFSISLCVLSLFLFHNLSFTHTHTHSPLSPHCYLSLSKGKIQMGIQRTQYWNPLGTFGNPIVVGENPSLMDIDCSKVCFLRVQHNFIALHIFWRFFFAQQEKKSLSVPQGKKDN